MSNDKNKVSIYRLLFAIALILVFPPLILSLGGNWLWAEGWIFSLWLTAFFMTIVIYLYIKNPTLFVERFNMPGSKGQKKWDVFITILLGLGFFCWIALMPLDAERFKWTASFPLWAKAGGGLLLIGPAQYLFMRSFMDNPYASGLVRIQDDRKQYVISNGVYGFVRHPMYSGAAFLFTGAPLLVGSLFGLTLGVLLTILLAVRSVGEEKMLANELNGYEDYKKKVKYRLMPLIW